MNTPKPCDICKHLYYDALSKDDPFYMAECKLNMTMGNIDCKHYLNYEEKKEYMTQMEQLKNWVEGKSIHDDSNEVEGGLCCPDFSCCVPELLASEIERKLFYKAYIENDRKIMDNMLMAFLGAMIVVASRNTGKKIYLAGEAEVNEV